MLESGINIYIRYIIKKENTCLLINIYTEKGENLVACKLISSYVELYEKTKAISNLKGAKIR